MEKIILILLTFLIFCPQSFAKTETMAKLEKIGFFSKEVSCSRFLTPSGEVKKLLFDHLKYANKYDLESLKKLYSKDYINADGFGRDVFFDLIKKTWDSYPDIKYKIVIKSINIDGNYATAQVDEYADATSSAKSSIVSKNGKLNSYSSSLYYLQKVNGDWLITSDYIVSEKTFLKYGSANELAADIYAPSRIYAGDEYTSSLIINAPEDNIIIASVGRENITYPQMIAEEVFRKLPQDGILERIFKANDKNANEYAVASYGITKVELKNGTEIKIYVTGLGFGMTRVNVIPKNSLVKVEVDEKTK